MAALRRLYGIVKLPFRAVNLTAIFSDVVDLANCVPVDGVIIAPL